MAVSGSSSLTNSIYSSIAAKNKGLGGLVSGLDTESLVEALTLATRSKISKQQQNKTLLQWKQTAYRSTATVLREFQTKYFRGTGSTNLKLNANYNVFAAKATDDSVKVTASYNSVPGTISVASVDSLATSKTYETTAGFDPKLTGSEFSMDQDFTGQTLQVALGSSTRTIKLDSLSGKYTSGGSSAFEAELQSLVNNAFGTQNSDGVTSIIKVALDDLGSGKAAITLDNGTNNANKISIYNDSKTLGLSQGQSNQFDSYTKLSDIFSGLVGVGSSGTDLTFTINGKTITAKTTDTWGTLQSHINSSGANARLSYDSVTGKITLTAMEMGAGNTLEVADVSGNLFNQAFGLAGGGSLSSGDIKADLGYQQILHGGVPGTGDVMALIGDIINNGAAFDITLNENSASSVTKTVNVQITQEDYDLFKLGVKKYAENVLELDEASFDFDDPDYGYGSALTTEQRDALDAYREEQAKTLLNQSVNAGIKTAFGSQVMGFGYDDTSGASGEASFQVVDKTNAMTISMVDNGTNVDLFTALGFDNSGTVTEVQNWGTPAQGTSLGALGTLASSGSFDIETMDASGTRQTEAFTWDNTMSVQDIMNEVNSRFGRDVMTVKSGVVSLNAGADGYLRVEDDTSATPVGEEDKPGLMQKLFLGNKTSYESGVGIPDTVDDGSGVQVPNPAVRAKVTEGTNAVITLANGQQMVSGNNSFEVNGTTFEVTKKLAAGFTINVTTDHTALVDQVKGFIEDYNTMVIALNNIIYEDKSSGYEPLTEEQKADMTEDQIKKWEEEAKKGLLRNDPALRSYLDKMRAAIYETVEAAGLAPYDVGITTASLTSSSSGTGLDYLKSGTLELDVNKLKVALENNADAVRLMFTDETNGLAMRLDKVIDSAVSTSSDSAQRGSLVTLAGTETLTADNTSSIGNKIDSIDKQIALLKTRLENEYNRYWKKFSALETAISNMNAQSSWLTSLSS